ncbi:MAG TPA: type VI secretion system tube protein Hcp [Planctomycetota bacterium]|nr:type VI secretion system tube protein Hcp [Planctomycetota bacterium]
MVRPKEYLDAIEVRTLTGVLRTISFSPSMGRSKQGTLILFSERRREEEMHYQILATFTDAKGRTVPGKFVPGRGHNQIVCQAVSPEALAPRDSASGQASGKRVHRPITLIGDLGPATPRLLGALSTHEVLTKAEISLYPISHPGVPPACIVRLSDVSVTRILPHASNTPVTGPRVIHSTGKTDTHELTRVMFDFEKIEVTFGSGKATAKDDWEWTG